jgi:uroporphyrinogen-III synthase
VLTRPEAQSAAFAEALQDGLPEGTGIVVSPVLDIRHLDWAPPPRADFAILTSAHAVPALARLPLSPGAPVYGVGPATAKAIREAGFTPVVGDGTADDLRDLIAAEAPHGAGCYLRGRHVSGDLAAGLRALGIEVAEAVVYDQREVPLTPAALAALTGRGTSILPLFSARSARLVAGQVPDPGPGVRIVAMSDTVAAAWPIHRGAVTVAPAPTADAMRNSVLELCRRRGAC